MFNIVLVEPEIPQNTGNISRTCAVTGCALHLVKPLGFEIDDKKLKRAGLDYWHSLELYYYDSFANFERQHAGARLFMSTTHAKKSYAECCFKPGDFLVFGKETAGLGADIISRYADTAMRIPMREGQRSLNLSNSAAIVLYEALRQNGFDGMK